MDIHWHEAIEQKVSGDGIHSATAESAVSPCQPLRVSDRSIRRAARPVVGKATLAKGGKWIPTLLAVLGIVIVVAVLTLGGVFLARERASQIEAEQRNGTNIARAFASHVEQTVDHIDQFLLRVQNAHAYHWPDFSQDVGDLVRVGGSQHDIGVFVIDQGGATRFATDGGHAGTKDILKTLPYWRGAVTQGDDLFIFMPLDAEAGSGKRVFFARRLTDSFGQFSGAVVVSAPTEFLGRTFGSVDLGPGGEITLIGPHGVVLAGKSAGAFPRQRTGTTMPEYAFLQSNAPVVGPLTFTTKISKEILIGGYATLPHYGLTVSITRPIDAVLAKFFDDSLASIVVTLFVVGFLLLTLKLIRRQAEQHEQDQRRLLDTQVELTAIAERSREVVARHAMALTRTNMDLERFATILAHHLQEPVRIQYIYAQQLAQLLGADGSEDVRECLDVIAGKSHRLRLLLTDVRRYLEAGRNVPANPVCNVDGAFSRALLQNRADLDHAGAAVEAGTMSVAVEMDAETLTDIFHCLLENAVAFRKPDVPLKIVVGAVVGPDSVTISVCDNGVGIPRASRKRVFLVFEQLAGGEHAGTGVGLALVNKYVESAGGRVWIDDGDQGGGDQGGICVRFTLPLAPPPPRS